ncbi:MAG: lysophospholipid acyltransferase family protein [Rhodanobacteraceae bacterium]
MRKRSWLPDAELDAHPLGTWLLEMGFDLWIRAFYDRVILFPDDFHIAPGTLIASNHQRDVDGPMLGTVLVRRKGLRFQWPLPFYATREDLFRAGILSRLTVHWPRPLSALLAHVPLAWFFSLGRAEPMRRTREFTLGEALHALIDAGLGDADTASVLNARGRCETGIVADQCRVCEAAERRNLPLDASWGLRRLAPAARARIAPAFRSTVAAQLAHFAQRLDRGRCVYFSPEGTISTNGHFGCIRAGFLRLSRTAELPPWIQPMALAYDTLAPGRSRVVVRIGDRFRADTTQDRRAFDATLRHAILQLAPVTPSHLLARWLLHGPVSFTRDELLEWLAHCLPALRIAHPSLDPLLASTRVRGLADQRLRWLERKDLVARRGGSFRNICARDVEPGWRTPANIARYLDNNLAELVPDTDRVLPC